MAASMPSFKIVLAGTPDSRAASTPATTTSCWPSTMPWKILCTVSFILYSSSFFRTKHTEEVLEITIHIDRHGDLMRRVGLTRLPDRFSRRICLIHFDRALLVGA